MVSVTDLIHQTPTPCKPREKHVPGDLQYCTGCGGCCCCCKPLGCTRKEGISWNLRSHQQPGWGCSGGKPHFVHHSFIICWVSRPGWCFKDLHTCNQRSPAVCCRERGVTSPASGEELGPSLGRHGLAGRGAVSPLCHGRAGSGQTRLAPHRVPAWDQSRGGALASGTQEFPVARSRCFLSPWVRRRVVSGLPYCVWAQAGSAQGHTHKTSNQNSPNASEANEIFFLWEASDLFSQTQCCQKQQENCKSCLCTHSGILQKSLPQTLPRPSARKQAKASPQLWSWPLGSRSRKPDAADQAPFLRLWEESCDCLPVSKDRSAPLEAPATLCAPSLLPFWHYCPSYLDAVIKIKSHLCLPSLVFL